MAKICNCFKQEPKLKSFWLMFFFIFTSLWCLHINRISWGIIHFTCMTETKWNLSCRPVPTQSFFFFFLHAHLRTHTHTHTYVCTLIHLAICQPLLCSNAVWIQAHKSARVAIEPETEEGFYWPHKNRCRGMFLSCVLMGRLDSPKAS